MLNGSNINQQCCLPRKHEVSRDAVIGSIAASKSWSFGPQSRSQANPVSMVLNMPRVASVGSSRRSCAMFADIIPIRTG